MKVASRRFGGFGLDVLLSGDKLNDGRESDCLAGTSNVKLPMLEPPWLHPRLFKLQDIGGSPMLCKVGSRTCEMYSYEGEPDTFVPPEIDSRIGLSLSVSSPFFGGLNKMNGSIACRARLVLPAVLMSSLQSQNPAGLVSSVTRRYAGDMEQT